MLNLKGRTSTCLYMNPLEQMSVEEADISYGIGLSVWGISEAKAKKIISRPLVFSPVK